MGRDTRPTALRIALGIEYDGQPFAGWESQVGQPTVQSALEAALARVADHSVRVVCAGRTDAGVHAAGQVAHFETCQDRPVRAWTLGTNSYLTGPVSVQWAKVLPPDFHARFSARCRHYRYLMLNRPTRPGLLHGRVAWVRQRLDVGAMQQAAEFLLGRHDFTSFRAAGCQASSPVRTIHAINVERHGEFVVVDVSANAFLQHMVRNLAGTLCAIGLGKKPVAWIEHLLELRDRTQAGMTMAPDGLYLLGVDYPDEYRVPRVSPTPVLW